MLEAIPNMLRGSSQDPLYYYTSSGILTGFVLFLFWALRVLRVERPQTVFWACTKEVCCRIVGFAKFSYDPLSGVDCFQSMFCPICWGGLQYEARAKSYDELPLSVCARFSVCVYTYMHDISCMACVFRHMFIEGFPFCDKPCCARGAQSKGSRLEVAPHDKA